MADMTGSGASTLLGNPAGTPPADSGAPPAGGAPATPPAGGDAGAGGAFYDSFQNPETKAWLQSKGVKSAEDLAVSYQSLEKHLGSEKVPVPKDPTDAQAWELFFKAGGRPDTADAYGLDKLEGADPVFAKSAADAFHKAGLNPTQAKLLTEFYATAAQGSVEAAAQVRDQQIAADLADLQKENGPAFAAKQEAARRAALQFGISPETQDKLLDALGGKGMFTLLSTIGEKIGDSTFRGGDGSGGTQFMTPALATQRIAQLKADPDWGKRYMDGGVAERAELQRLQKIELGNG